MILKLPKETNRKVRSNCMIWLYAIIYAIYRTFSFRYFLLFWKRIFLFCIRKAKINVYLVVVI